jgi:Domain of unknown function (DUF4326)
MSEEKILQISSPYFTAAVIVAVEGRVKRAAPDCIVRRRMAIRTSVRSRGRARLENQTGSMMPQVLNKHRVKYEDAPKAVYVGRGSPWGNPFKIGRDGTRAEVIARFEREILPEFDVSMLRGKDLLCWCAPLPCHADLLLKKANGIEGD